MESMKMNEKKWMEKWTRKRKKVKTAYSVNNMKRTLCRSLMGISKWFVNSNSLWILGKFVADSLCVCSEICDRSVRVEMWLRYYPRVYLEHTSEIGADARRLCGRVMMAVKIGQFSPNSHRILALPARQCWLTEWKGRNRLKRVSGARQISHSLLTGFNYFRGEEKAFREKSIFRHIRWPWLGRPNAFECTQPKLTTRVYGEFF